MKKETIITVPNTVRINESILLETGDRIMVLDESEQLEESDYGYYRMEVQQAVPVDRQDIVSFQVRSTGGASKWINLNAQSLKALKDVFNL